MRITSKPRNIVPALRALTTCGWPPTVSTVISTERCPSMRVTGSIVIVVGMHASY
jgi:hypothetical protein